MDASDRRQAARIECHFALLLRGTWTHVRAQVEDVSRDGARLTLNVQELGLPPNAGLNEIARQLRHLLTADVVAHFQPELLGSLVTRKVRPVRLARHEGPVPLVEIGCTFQEPLIRTEVAALGLPIPLRGESEEEARQSMPAQPPQVRDIEVAPGVPTAEVFAGRHERSMVRVHVTAAEREDLRSFVAYVEQVAEEWVEILVPDRRTLELPTDLPDVRAATMALCDTWGEHVLIGVARDDQDRWSKRANVESVDLLPLDPDALRVRYAFVTPLRPDELALLRSG